MRQKLLSEGAKELEYEIRDIVKKAEKVHALGQEIYFENIGDPIQKNAQIPAWIKDIVTDFEDALYDSGDTNAHETYLDYIDLIASALGVTDGATGGVKT